MREQFFEAVGEAAKMGHMGQYKKRKPNKGECSNTAQEARGVPPVG